MYVFCWIQYQPEPFANRLQQFQTQWGKWRFPCGYGARFPDMAFDALPWIGLLLRDLGLKVNRKSGTFAEITEPYTPRDFVGLVDEWRDLHSKR